MFTTLTVLLAFANTTGMDVSSVLFESAKWYQDAKGVEKSVEGVLEINPTSAQIGVPARFSSYRLSWLENNTLKSRPVFTNGKDYLLAPYLGYRIEFAGKLVETEIDGKPITELWPARLAVKGVAPHGVTGELKIFGRTNENINAMFGTGRAAGGVTEPYVIRDGQELAKRMRFGGEGSERIAMQRMAMAFGLREIDWSKQMLVCIGGGVQAFPGARVEVARATVMGKQVEFHWKLTGAAGGGGPAILSYPCEVLLTERFDGEIHFFANENKRPVIIPALDAKNGVGAEVTQPRAGATPQRGQAVIPLPPPPEPPKKP